MLPHVDGDQIQYVGEAHQEFKRELLSSARCLLAPITWAEPFGLFMVEAMACGTPVVAFRRGSVPEVVSHGESGFVVDGVDEMVDAIPLVDGIEPLRCRQFVERNFDVPRMADDYEAVYTRVILGDHEPSVPALSLLADVANRAPSTSFPGEPDPVAA